MLTHSDTEPELIIQWQRAPKDKALSLLHQTFSDPDLLNRGCKNRSVRHLQFADYHSSETAKKHRRITINKKEGFIEHLQVKRRTNKQNWSLSTTCRSCISNRIFISPPTQNCFLAKIVHSPQL